MFIAFAGLSRKGSGSSDKNDLEACLQGVFSDKARRRKAPSLQKGLSMFMYKIIHHAKIQQNSHIRKYFGHFLCNVGPKSV